MAENATPPEVCHMEPIWVLLALLSLIIAARLSQKPKPPSQDRRDARRRNP